MCQKSALSRVHKSNLGSRTYTKLHLIRAHSQGKQIHVLQPLRFWPSNQSQPLPSDRHFIKPKLHARTVLGERQRDPSCTLPVSDTTTLVEPLQPRRVDGVQLLHPKERNNHALNHRGGGEGLPQSNINCCKSKLGCLARSGSSCRRQHGTEDQKRYILRSRHTPATATAHAESVLHTTR